MTAPADQPLKDMCPKCGSTEKAWMERSPDGRSKCVCGFEGKHTEWINAQRVLDKVNALISDQPKPRYPFASFAWDDDVRNNNRWCDAAEVEAAFDAVVEANAILRFRMDEAIHELRAQVEKLTAENEDLKVYKKTVYGYVQCTGNTSPKTLGYHVAEALVMDHKEIKAKLARLEAELAAEKLASGTCADAYTRLTAANKELTEALEKSIAHIHCPRQLTHEDLIMMCHRAITDARKALARAAEIKVEK